MNNVINNEIHSNMNTLKHLFYLVLITLTVISCARDYDAPPIPEPIYKGTANITIAQLKQKYINTVSGAPSLIDVDYVFKAYVVGNDESGNIFKQVYVEDESGAINIGVDQSGIYTTLRVGQEVYINVHGFSMVNYGGELQIGYNATNANRIPWEIFKERIGLNSWPNPTNAIPTVVKLSELNETMANKLVRIDNIYFVNGGKNNFTTGNATTNEPIKDGDGKSLDVRSSSFATFAADKLPEGGGSIVGVLGRFNGAWQLFIRTTADLISFGGPLPPPTGPEVPPVGIVFSETFGNGSYTTIDTRLKIADFTDFDMKSPVVYTDPTNNADIRSTTTINAHVWLPASKDAGLTISGIKTSGISNPVLTFDVAASVSTSAGAVSSGNLNAMTVKCNGVTLTIPSTPVSAANGDGNKYYTFTLKNIPAVENLTLEFFANSTTGNDMGLRLDNIKIASDNSITLP